MPGVPEDTAQGAVADVYADYRALTGLARTPLLLRELATHGPDVLTAVWEGLRAHYAGPGLHAAARRLLDGLHLPVLRLVPGELGDAGPDADLLLRRVQVTLGMFAAANATNLVVVHLIGDADPDGDAPPHVPADNRSSAAEHAAAERTAAEASAASDGVAPLPLPEPEDLPAGRADQVMAIARRLVDDPPPGWWPSLLLHLAPFPRLLDGVEREVDGNAAALRTLARTVDARAARHAAELRRDGRTARLDGAARAAAEELAARYRRVLPALAVLAACPVEVASEPPQ